MRGKVPEHLADKIAHRITPAYAGKSGKAPAETERQRDHPRLCGEKLALAGKFTGKVGSPPPMRGKVTDRGR